MSCDNFPELVDKIYKIADEDGKGATPGSLCRTIRQFLKHFDGDDQYIAKTFLEIDKDGDCRISLEEFKKAMHAIPRNKVTKSMLLEQFEKIDSDNSGQIDKEELRALVKSLGQNWSEPKLDAALADADTSGDGLISFKEFLKNWG